MPLHTCHTHSSSTDSPPAQQLKQQQQHGAWEQHLQLCDTEEGCTGCRVCEGTLSKNQRKSLLAQKSPQKSPAARNVVTHPLGDGAARLPERARSPTPHTVHCTCGASSTRRVKPPAKYNKTAGQTCKNLDPERSDRTKRRDTASSNGGGPRGKPLDD